MAREYTGASGDQKVLRLSEQQIEEVRRRAEKRGSSMSEVLRDIIEDFLQRGSDYRKPSARSVKMYVDSDVVLHAERKAQEENGASLGDIIRHALS